jgi:hypothetical protein
MPHKVQRKLNVKVLGMFSQAEEDKSYQASELDQKACRQKLSSNMEKNHEANF